MRGIKRSTFVLGVFVLISIGVIISVTQGYLFSADNTYKQLSRFMAVLKIIRSYYVEEVDTDKLITGAIEGMLDKLDPHSIYIEPKKLKEITEQFQGSYQGIGIEFIIQNKILTVVAPIAGSPSEALGIRPGDRIIKIEGESTYGITETEVQKKLKGPKGTKVTVTIKRPGLEEPFDLTITRDRIPIYSVMAHFMIDDKIGYIYVGRFAQTTVAEFDRAYRELQAKGMKALLLDLRGNTGGYLDQAFKLADRFIEGGKKIVFTKGRIPESNTEFLSTDRATIPKIPLIILIDKGSASASEIVSGAIQDWDRGLIVGQTSFGKGLVQTQIPLSDGSAVRITTARYYTPSGRLIQRSYEHGLMDYYTSGYEETVKSENEKNNNRPVFYTHAGRKVYGGGGITPDVKIESKPVTRFTTKLIFQRLFFEFGSRYASRHKNLAKDFQYFKKNFIVDKQILTAFRAFVKSKKLEFKEDDFKKDLQYIKLMIKADIARNLWGSKEYYEIRILGDEQVQEALKHFNEAAKIAQIKGWNRIN